MSHDREEGADIRTLGLLLVLFLLILFILWLIQLLSAPQSAACPAEAFRCEQSPCGCCVKDGFGDPISYCDSGKCGTGFVLNSQGECCNINDLSRCISMQDVCVAPLVCNEQNPCCPGYLCNTTGGCIPCEANLLCNPTDVNSCCTGFACNANGRCESTTLCALKECSTKGEACKVCDSSGNCTACQDKSICIYNTALKKNTCSPQGDCPDGYVLNLDITSKCKCISVLDGSCPDCAGRPCSQEELGKSCSICDRSGKCALCASEMCANVEGSYTCMPRGKCIDGYECTKCTSGCCKADGTCSETQKCVGNTVPCDTCISKCCNADGTCLGGEQCITKCDASTKNNPCNIICDGTNCMPCDDKICVNVLGGGQNVFECMPQGKAPYGYVEDPKCNYGIRDPSTGLCFDLLDPNFATDSPEGYVCIKLNASLPFGGWLNFPLYCNSSGCYHNDELPPDAEIKYYCTSKDERTCAKNFSTGKCIWLPYSLDEYNNKKKCPLCPDRILPLFDKPPDICLDCQPQCATSGAVYDLNGDHALDELDLAIFDVYVAGNKPYDRRYDFNSDNVVDVQDRKCVEDACSSGCRVMNITSISTCINTLAYPPEARAALGSQIHNFVSGQFNISAYASAYPTYSKNFSYLKDEIGYFIYPYLRPSDGTMDKEYPSPYITVERGHPYIYGSNASIEKSYYSGCVYFSNYMTQEQQGGPGLPMYQNYKVLVMHLDRAPGCSSEISASVTDNLNVLIEGAAKNMFQTCFSEGCSGHSTLVILACKAAADGLCENNTRCRKKKCEPCAQNLSSACDALGNLIHKKCISYSQTFRQTCGDDKTLVQCTTDESKKQWCGTLININKQECLSLRSTLDIKYWGAWETVCNTYVQLENLPCKKSFESCYLDTLAFSNLVKRLILDDAVKKLDEGSGVVTSNHKQINVSSLSTGDICCPFSTEPCQGRISLPDSSTPHMIQPQKKIVETHLNNEVIFECIDESGNIFFAMRHSNVTRDGPIIFRNLANVAANNNCTNEIYSSPSSFGCTKISADEMRCSTVHFDRNHCAYYATYDSMITALCPGYTK